MGKRKNKNRTRVEGPKVKISHCPCGSRRAFVECCEPYLALLPAATYVDTLGGDSSETVLFDWLQRYSPPIMEAFVRKTRPDIFRISKYLDYIQDVYLWVEYPNIIEDHNRSSRAFLAIKHNILLSILGALRCISEGLLVQNGILVRSAIEDSFGLLDLYLNSEQVAKLFANKYKASTALTRLKGKIPAFLFRWYGVLSANYAHMGPLHRAPYMPRACYPDNWVIGIGLENIILAAIAYHIVLERIHLSAVQTPLFWRFEARSAEPMFNEKCEIFEWKHMVVRDTMRRYPPDEHKEGFVRSEEQIRLKK